ncbi:Threonine--tRNA ligase, mitochondrial 1 [Linum perenne]
MLYLQIDEGDGAFYGPNIDISVSKALKRKFRCATLQLDFQLSDRFELEYSAEDEAKLERPVMIHRAILGFYGRYVRYTFGALQGEVAFLAKSSSSNHLSCLCQIHGLY